MEVQGQIQGHCAYMLFISTLDTMLPSHPRATPTPTRILKNCLIKLPQHVQQQNHGINTTAGISISSTVQEHVALALQSLWTVCELYQKKYPSQVTNCPLLTACPSDPYFPFLSSPRIASSTLMKLSSWEIKWLEHPALLVSPCVESTHTSGGGRLPALAPPLLSTLLCAIGSRLQK